MHTFNKMPKANPEKTTEETIIEQHVCFTLPWLPEFIALNNNQDALQLNQNTQNHLHQPEAALRIHQAEAILRSQAEAALRLAVSQAAAVAASSTASNNLNNNANNNCNANNNQSNGEQTERLVPSASPVHFGAGRP